MAKQKLTLGSLFDGSGTFPLGALMAGIQPVWSSDIEPFPIRVTTKRLPMVKHYGDIHAMDGGGSGAVQQGYAVRRLTPTECARLQGFPDGWCAGLGTENPSEDEMAFWRDVFETHRKVIGTAKKSKTDAQIRKWLQNPHSDSAEYRMWGNGCSLPVVFYVLMGISHFARL